MSAIIVFALCVVGAFAGTLRNKEPELNFQDSCLEEYGIFPGLISNGTQSLAYEDVYCVAACIYRNLGTMRPDGTIDLKVAENYFSDKYPKDREIFYNVYESCKEGRVACKLVQCMFEELKNNYLGKIPDSDQLSRGLLTTERLFKFF